MLRAQARSIVLASLLAALSLGVNKRASAEPPHGASGAVPEPTSSTTPDATPPPPPAVKLPVLKRNDGAEYPKQALLDGVRDPVTVSLLLELDATGTVKSAVVKKPVGHGFDEAATAAALRLLFEPATRNGVAFAIKISFDYPFAPPPAALVGRVATQVTSTPLAGAHVTALGPSGKVYSATTDARGRYRIAALPAGSYMVRVEAAGFDASSATQALAPGQEASIVDRLEPTHATPLSVATAITSNAPPPKTEAVSTEEVHVQGTRAPREVTVRTLEQRELTRIPGTNGDALRALQNLPGVARPPTLLGLLVVRGSAPQDTNVFVDGTLIPIVYHFGGLSSVIPSEMLEKIDFYPGNFGAEYGRVMGGVVDVGVRNPKHDKLHGMAQVDFIDARVMAEGPIGNTGWNFAVGGRRSYVDLWLKPVLEKAGAGVSTAPVYYDYQAMVQRDFNSHSSARILFFGSDDKLDILVKSVSGSDPSFAGGLSTHTGFWRLQGRYINRFNDDTRFRLTSAVGQDFVDFSVGDNFFHINSYPITTRAEIGQKLARGVTANVGLDMLYVPYDVAVRVPPPPRPGEAPSGPFLERPPLETKDSNAIFRPGLYTELEVTPWIGGRIVPGVRLDYAKDTQAWDVAPRVSARQDLHTEYPRTTLKGGVGVYFQPPQPQETNAVFGIGGLRSNRALHYGLGVEQEVTRNVDLSFEGFYKQLDYLVTQRVGNVGNGRAYGLETLIRFKPDARFFGWLAYTLSRSERTDIPGTPLHLSAFDQTHILTVLGSYRLGLGWELGARFRLVSGNPYTPNTYGFNDENAGAYLPLLAYPPNDARLAVFHQLDVRVDKTWVYQNGDKLGVYLDIQNVYNNGNVEGVSYNYNNTLRSFATGLPIIPSLGIRGEL